MTICLLDLLFYWVRQVSISRCFSYSIQLNESLPEANLHERLAGRIRSGRLVLPRTLNPVYPLFRGMASRKWSAVWLYYQDGKDAKKVVCLICLETIQHHGNTSNLRRHLRLKHHAEYADLEAKKKRGEAAGGIRKQPVPGVQCGHYSGSGAQDT